MPPVLLDNFNIEKRGSQFNAYVVPQDDIHLCAAGGGDISQVDDVPPPKPRGQQLGHLDYCSRVITTDEQIMFTNSYSRFTFSLPIRQAAPG
jgi:hypothetical protein